MRFAVLVLSTMAVLAMRDQAEACSCAGPQASLLTPNRGDDTPLNARVRIEVPEPMPEGSSIVFRAYGTTANVKTTQRKMPYGPVNVIELVPASPLAASTQYEVGLTDPNKHPATTIFGTFKTGTTSDTTAPKIDKMGAVNVLKGAPSSGGTCGVAGPWVTIDSLSASDGPRGSEQLAYAIWLADASGRVDETKPPTIITKPSWNGLSLGPQSICDPHAFPYPKGTMTFGIAAIDEAGNISAVKKATVNMAAAKSSSP